MVDYEDSNSELYRRQVIQLERKLKTYEKTIQDLQEQVYNGYKRIKELQDEKEMRAAMLR